MNTLRKRLQAGERGMAFVGAPTALFARLIERHGFDGVYVSGAGLSTAIHAMPDDGSLTLEQVAAFTEQVCGATSLPVLVDADVGFSDEGDIGPCVQRLEQAGAAAIQIEDQVSAKKCGHLSGKQLVPPALMCDKLRSAAAARRDPGLVLVARTDARGVTDWDDAVTRAEAYRAAGADVIFIEALPDADEFQRFPQASPGPLLANMTEFGRSPLIDRATLGAWGYTVVIYPVTLLRRMLAAADAALAELAAEGTQAALVDGMYTRKQLYELIDYGEAVPDWPPPAR